MNTKKYMPRKNSTKVLRVFRRIFSNRTEKVNRTKTGNIALYLFIIIIASFSAVPLIMAIAMSLKPINELFLFPPTLLPRNPTFNNFADLFRLLNITWVPFSRYAFNTVFITVVTIIGHVIIASLAAFPLAKHKFKGQKLINRMILLSLMFVPAVADVANYIIISTLGWIDTYLAVIVPAMGSTLGIFLMRNFMVAAIPDQLLEAARIDGASEIRTFWKIVMPIVKPAWLTLIIILFQWVWSDPHTVYIYKEEMKTLPYALSQIVSGGLVRAGAAQAVGVIMMLVPALVFVINQAKILETMASSGIKE